MPSFKRTVPMAALAAIIASPLYAQETSGNTEVQGQAGVGVDVGAPANATAEAGASVGAEAETQTATNEAAPEGAQGDATGSAAADVAVSSTGGAATAPERRTATATGLEASEMSAIQAGEAMVMSSNDAVLGTVESVESGADGKLHYRVNLSDSLGTDVDRVTLVSSSGLNADGTLRVRMTDEEFAAAATQQAEAMSGAAAGVN